MKHLPSYDLSSLRFLIADHNPHDRQLIREVLNSFHVRYARGVGDGAEALKIIKEWRPDILLTEYHMPPIDGMELARTLRTATDSPSEMLPIIMITAYSEANHVSQARDAGINEFLAKPFKPIDLYKRIVQLIENPRAFVRAPSYTGPDRHRRRDDNYDGPERRKNNDEFS